MISYYLLSQPNQTTRTLTTSGVNRISIPASVIGNQSRIPGTLQALPGKKLTIGTTTPAGAAPNRIVIPQHNVRLFFEISVRFDSSDN